MPMIIRTCFNNQGWSAQCTNAAGDSRLLKCQKEVINTGFHVGKDGQCDTDCYESSLCTSFCWYSNKGNINKEKATGDVFFVYPDRDNFLILWGMSKISNVIGSKIEFSPFSPLYNFQWKKFTAQKLVGNYWKQNTYRFITNAKANAIKRILKKQDENDLYFTDTVEIDFEDGEGKKRLVQHLERERSSKLIYEFKKKLIATGKLRCEVCGINFQEQYGSIGENFIEAHHIKPVYLMKPGEKTSINDLRPVCSNCHRMLHRRQEPLMTLDALKQEWAKHNASQPSL